MSCGHFIEKCRNCKDVISQCRCMGPKETKWSLCSKCKHAQNKGEKKMQAYQERVVEEKRELDEKVAKLGAFMSTEPFAVLPVEEQGRMNRQRALMECYGNVLGERIEAF